MQRCPYRRDFAVFGNVDQNAELILTYDEHPVHVVSIHGIRRVARWFRKHNISAKRSCQVRPALSGPNEWIEERT